MRGKKLIFTIIAFCFIFLFLCGVLNRTGSLILTWKELPPGGISHDAGFGNFAFLPDENITRLALPVFLLEDGEMLDPGPLSVNEDRTALIKEKGGGSWQVLGNNDLYFSAASGQPEEHEYEVISPRIIRNRYLLALALPALLSAAAVIFYSLKTKNSDVLREISLWLGTAFMLLLLFPWNRAAFPGSPRQMGGFLFKPLLQRNTICILLLAILLTAAVLTNKKTTSLKWLAVLAVLLNTLWYFLPEWNYYGMRADSLGYIRKYDASSIRTPGYPLFISGVYGLSGSEGLETLRAREEPVTDEQLFHSGKTDSRGLINVTRAQKLVLGAAFLVLFAVWCRYYSPLLFLFAAQIILSGGFLGVDNSYIMTECLSQALTLLFTAMLLVVIKERLPWAYVLMCLLGGAAVLVRPANIILALPLLVCVIILFRHRRGLWFPLGGFAVFAALCAIPALIIFLQYRIFVWMPSSGYVDIARAIRIMEPGDEALFADPESHAFAVKLLEKKQELGDADQSTYTFEAALPAAEALGYDRITCSPLFSRVSRKIFLTHPGAFADSLAGEIRTALERTRLKLGPASFPILLAIFTITALLRISTESLTGLGLAALHCIHLCLSMINQPERRYIYSTEIICLIGWLLICVSVFRTLQKKYTGDHSQQEMGTVP